MNPKQVSDSASDLLLNGEDILQLAAKRLGPKVMTAGGLNRLRSDPQLLAGLSDAAFNDEIRPEPLPYITDIDSDPFELERRCPRNHVKLWQVRERVEDLFADPVAEIVLFAAPGSC